MRAGCGRRGVAPPQRGCIARVLFRLSFFAAAGPPATRHRASPPPARLPSQLKLAEEAKKAEERRAREEKEARLAEKLKAFGGGKAKPAAGGAGAGAPAPAPAAAPAPAPPPVAKPALDRRMRDMMASGIVHGTSRTSALSKSARGRNGRVSAVAMARAAAAAASGPPPPQLGPASDSDS